MDCKKIPLNLFMDQYNIINIIFFQKEFKLIMCFNLIEKSNVCVMCYT